MAPPAILFASLPTQTARIDRDMNRLGPGQTLDGKYQILRTLGEGGMGVVYEAHHLRLEQQVAVKCLLPALMDDRTLVARFEREARAAARLRSRHVVKILDVANEAASGMPYMVMELLHGHDLQAEAAACGGKVPLENLAEWICQVAGALAEAHDTGVVHRDLKPSNIFLCDEPNERIAKVLDFGIAKANAIVPGITYTTAGAGSVCGTPHYMSPEQITAAEVDGRSDVWALAVVTYEMLAGKVPFDAQSFTALAVKIVNEQPVHLSTIRPDLPPELCEAVMRGITKDLAVRHQTMREFAEALAPFTVRGEIPTWVGKVKPSSRRLLPSVDSSARFDVHPTLAATSFPTGNSERSKRGLLVGAVSIGALVIVGAVGFGVLALSAQSKQKATAASLVAVETSQPPATAGPLPTGTAVALRTDPTAEPAPTSSAAPTSSTTAKKVGVASTKPPGKPILPGATGSPPTVKPPASGTPQTHL